MAAFVVQVLPVELPGIRPCVLAAVLHALLTVSALTIPSYNVQRFNPSLRRACHEELAGAAREGSNILWYLATVSRWQSLQPAGNAAFRSGRGSCPAFLGAVLTGGHRASM